jgi:heme iron utilization protein
VTETAGLDTTTEAARALSGRIMAPVSPAVATTCRDLASRARFGSLATVARDPAGHPFVTLVAVATDEAGRPLLYLSDLAEHTKNLGQDARASLLVWETADDPLAAGRMTLVGACARLAAGGSEMAGARGAFLAAHPAAATYASLPDFALWRLEVASVRWIGGFGRMTWIDGDAYARGA